MLRKRLLPLLAVLLLLAPCLALAQSGPALIPLAGAHAVILHDNGTTVLVGGADVETAVGAMEEIGFYGVDYVVEVCAHSKAARALAERFGAVFVAYRQQADGLDMRWEGERLYIRAAGQVFVFGAAQAEPGAVSLRCDGTLCGGELPKAGSQYMLNLNTKKFHLPGCSSIGQMKDKNKKTYIGDREDVIERGFVPCKRCKP